MSRILLQEYLTAFRDHLLRDEKSAATIKKYLRDAHTFYQFTDGKEVTKDLTVAFKKTLEVKNYAVRSINSILASLNSLLQFLGWTDCKVKNLRCQRQVYCSEEKELTKAEYLRLLDASKKQVQLNLLIQTICATGIRVSELKHFTVEAVKHEEIAIRCKGKTSIILIPSKLKKLLLDYTKQNGISTGAIFITKGGKPLDRSNIWTRMKKLCVNAHVNPSKVYPHNLRKLFARTFYSVEKDIAKLADILGHGSIETTRIYIMTTGNEHRRKMDKLGLVV